MILLAICDDMADQLSLARELTDEYIRIHNVDIQLRLFVHPDELLTVLETEHFHVYILDIVMPMINGVQLGREIRKRDKDAQIIYTTTEPQFALESFSANPLNYLIKPLSKEKYFDTLSMALSKVTDNINKTLMVKTSDGFCMLNYSEIICCEYSRHTVKYYTLNSEIVTTVTMREPFVEIVEPLLDDYRFIQPHVAYVINMSRVERMTKDTFYMQCGVVVSIAQKRYAMVSDAYFDYLLKKGGSTR